MSVRPLSLATAIRLRDAALTAPAELSVHRETPPGYHRLRHRDLVPSFDRAAVALMTWRMHTGAGLGVRASGPQAREGSVVAIGLGAGPARLWMPCRVTDVVDEPGRAGFTYATLPGHLESGVEEFGVERTDDGAAWCTITAVSKPGSWITALAGPAARLGQDFFARRYLRALMHAS